MKIQKLLGIALLSNVSIVYAGLNGISSNETLNNMPCPKAYSWTKTPYAADSKIFVAARRPPRPPGRGRPPRR